MLVNILRGVTRSGLVAVLAPVLGFMFAGCTRPEVTAPEPTPTPAPTGLHDARP